eukprot:15485492-Alexandrium_andersonii.AAC.1
MAIADSELSELRARCATTEPWPTSWKSTRPRTLASASESAAIATSSRIWTSGASLPPRRRAKGTWKRWKPERHHPARGRSTSSALPASGAGLTASASLRPARSSAARSSSPSGAGRARSGAARPLLSRG